MSELIDWMDEYGLKHSLIDTFGLNDVSRDKRPAVLFGTGVGFERLYFLDDAQPRVKWRSQRQAAAHWYGLQQAPDQSILYVLSDAADVWTAHQLGLAAVTTCSTSALPMDFGQLAGWEVRIVFRHNTNTDYAQELARKFQREGIQVEIRSWQPELFEQVELQTDQDIDREGFGLLELHRFVGDDASEYLHDLEVGHIQDDPRREHVYFDDGGELDLGEWLIGELQKQSDGVAPIYDMGRIWTCDPAHKIWMPHEDHDLEARLADLRGRAWVEYETKEGMKVKPVKFDRVSLYRNSVAHTKMRCTHTGFFDEAPNAIAFQNGTLKASTEGAFFTSNHWAEDRVQTHSFFDFDYVAEQKSPLLEQFFRDVFEGCPDVEERITFLKRWMGAAFIGMATRYMRALVLKGRRGTGKSTLIGIIASLFPDDAVTSIHPQDFTNDTKLAGLVDSKLNAIYEGNRERLKPDILKSVVEGLPQEVELKYVRNTLKFRPRAAHIYAFNRLPQIPGSGPAVYDRFAVMTLPNLFRGTDRENKDIAQEIMAERPAIISWVIEGANEVLKDGLPLPPSCIEELDDWASNADGVAKWLRDNCDTELPKSAYEWTRVSSAYEDYRKFCGESGYNPTSAGEFKDRLIDRGVQFTRSDGSRLGVALKSSMTFH
jgi:putative DNA primase/helicase